MRRSTLRKRLTAHEGGADAGAPEPEPEAGMIDFDGYLVLPAVQEEIAALDLLSVPKAYPGPTLILNLSPRPKVAGPLEELASLYVSGEARVVRQEPIWSTVGLIDAAPTIAATMDWLRGALQLPPA